MSIESDHRPARDPIGQRQALDELHHERADAALVLEAVDGGDVLVGERGENFGLALESRDAIRLRRQIVG